jgi:hypothetical protein
VGGEISRYTQSPQSTISATRRVQGAEPVTGDTAEDDGLVALPVLWDGRNGLGVARRACSPDAPMAKPSSRTAWPREEARGSGPSLHFGQAQDCRGSVVNATGVFKRLSNPAAQHIRLVPGLPARRSPALIPPTTQETVNFLWRAGLRRHRIGEITAVAAGGNFVSWCP